MGYRRKIQWKPGEAPAVKFLKKPLRVYVDDGFSAVSSDYRAALVPGSLWTLATNAVVEPDSSFRHENKYLFVDPLIYGNNNSLVPNGVIPRGTPAVYVGTKRVEESFNGTEGTVVRHAFLVDGVVYLARHARTFKPAV